VIAERYDDPAITLRHLEQLFWATLWQSIPHKESKPSEAESFAQELVHFSHKAYRELVELPYFENYMRHCTVLPLIEKLPIGSRPSRRTGVTRLEDLRAIPFTFAWNQVRMPINAFYGLGAAFDALSDEGRRRASDLYRQWPWFRAIIDNAELALERCDTAIARRYAQRAPRQEEALQLWRRLRDEHDASRRAVFQIKQGRTIVEEVPWLHRTIQVRNPYLDMLNLVQLELMARLDSNQPLEEPAVVEAALRQSVQAIAAGLRNTG
jgi:phosphoenolpyruvate carboxylase